VDPTRLFHEAIRLFEDLAAAKGLALDFRTQGDLPAWLLLDADRVRQVLMNLIGNAVKFTDSGRVSLSARYDPEWGRLVARVEDSGPGLDAAQQAQLFRRFSQVDASPVQRFGGTGLGLAICKGLVEAMGGEIGVDSRPGAGSVFHFSIPASVVRGETPAVEAPIGHRIAGARVLLVDDDPSNRELAAGVLLPLGAEVVEAGDGQAGVAAAAGRPFDAILMDLRMPGLDGRGATAAIRGGHGPNRRTPIVAFSANLGEPAEAPAGFDGFVRKPFSAEELTAAVAACLPPAPA
jgi:CheY-like chemotaxis protein